jgi:predicted nucleotidyltransferase component of viral defense system
MHTLIKSLQNIVKEGKEKDYEESKIRVILKEYLQDIILYALYNNSQTSKLIFYGGSSLRKIYDLDRFSEDLDFENPEGIGSKTISYVIKKYFDEIDLQTVECKIQESNNIMRVTVKFPIVKELGMSGYDNEKLHVKVEVNNHLTGSYPTELTSKMLRNYPVIMKHYDLSTLFACKIIACLNREYVKGKKDIYVKGRDFYDLVWFMNNTKVLPNEKKLLDVNEDYSVENVFNLLDEKVKSIKPSDLFEDLQYLIEDGEYAKKWCDNFYQIYLSGRKRFLALR